MNQTLLITASLLCLASCKPTETISYTEMIIHHQPENGFGFERFERIQQSGIVKAVKVNDSVYYKDWVYYKIARP